MHPDLQWVRNWAMRQIGILTSGGDASGMNAAIRAVVRAGASIGIRTMGVRNGFDGLMHGDFHRLGPRSVANILQRGGTILGTSRATEIETPEGRSRAAEQFTASNLDGLVIIGGEGTLRAGHMLHEEHGCKIVAVPATIDNDIPSADASIGFDTAVNAAVEAMDRIRDTAESSGRVFFVEVMGRTRGLIALYAGLSGGADAIVIPEEHEDIGMLCRRLISAQRSGKRSLLVVVAEGDQAGGAFSVAEQVQQRLSGRLQVDYRVTVLGHLQRGGVPTARDRVLGTVLGAAAVECLNEGMDHHLVSEVDGALAYTPMADVLKMTKELPSDLMHLLHTVGQS